MNTGSDALANEYSLFFAQFCNRMYKLRPMILNFTSSLRYLTCVLRRALASASIALILASVGWASPYQLQPVWSQLPQLTTAVYLPHRPQQWLAGLKTGELYWLHDASGRSESIHRFAVSTQSEMGLLAVQLHPDFPADPRVFVLLNPSGAELRTELQQWHWQQVPGQTPRLVQPEVVLSVPQPNVDHKGGGLVFGADGYLYVGLGDGGSVNNDLNVAQNSRSWLGKVLRLDINQRRLGIPYSIPPDNPWVGAQGYLPEIWALGVRNPTHLAFDDKAQLWLVEAAQDGANEINTVFSGSNLGWRCLDGGRRLLNASECLHDRFQAPVFAYQGNGMRRMVGGVWYQGGLIPSLEQHFLFADFKQGNVWALSQSGQVQELLSTDLNPSTFIQRPDGEILLADFLSGKIYQIIRTSQADDDHQKLGENEADHLQPTQP